MKFEIKHRYSEAIIYQDEAESFRLLIMAAVKSGTDLYGANLSGANLGWANLREANLREANLYKADLCEADLYGANLSGANLGWANLREANLREANLYKADLYRANLYKTNLSGANLCGTDLYGANLYKADLCEANLCKANLYKADLRGTDLYKANLSGAKNISELAAAESNILPEGPIIGWKKCQNNVIVKLLIPAKARKSSAAGRKCRAEFVRVLAVFGAEVGISTHNPCVEYRKGETVTCDTWDEDRWVECGGGIHFFISRIEAESY